MLYLLKKVVLVVVYVQTLARRYLKWATMVLQRFRLNLPLIKKQLPKKLSKVVLPALLKLKIKEKMTMNEMFCFQCEQTAMCKGCTGRAGVCGKPADTAKLQDKLTGALIGLSRAVKISKVNTASTDKALLAGLFTTITNASFSNDAINAIIDQVHAEINKIAPHDHVIDYDVDKIWQDNEDIRSLKSLILFGLRGMAAYAYHAMMLKYTDKEVNSFFYEALFMLGEDADMNTLLP